MSMTCSFMSHGPGQRLPHRTRGPAPPPFKSATRDFVEKVARYSTFSFFERCVGAEIVVALVNVEVDFDTFSI